MTDLVIRPLVAGEENLFDSMPDPLPQLRQVGYADGIAGGGYRPETTWVALRSGRVVGRAAWVLPPGAVGAPWLERFDLDAEPEVGAALLHAAHEALGGPGLYYAACRRTGAAGRRCWPWSRRRWLRPGSPGWWSAGSGSDAPGRARRCRPSPGGTPSARPPTRRRSTPSWPGSPSRTC